MKPILPGERGPAVEDVQRRLLVLGYDLGPTGVDGVFFGKTRDAVECFQREHGLTEDGVVGIQTWAAIVDATFALGDRMLYLRLPHFHGNDVRVLQEALNTLGFSCGAVDGIFGSFTERAVREFQRSSGQPRDGIVGPETVRALSQLRHVWEGKDSTAPELAHTAPARTPEALTRRAVAFVPRDPVASDVAERAVNLALATDPEARAYLGGGERLAGTDVVLEVHSVEPGDGDGGQPLVTVALGDRTDELAGRFSVALKLAPQDPPVTIRVVLSGVGSGERARQSAAVLLLDAVCRALALWQ
ncbi:MAG TPA: peptidoglycan-binding protein [Coriobacteriia bacterium]|nr:peptidoglycan-binding protein [Coriobacteriia bacterium]